MYMLDTNICIYIIRKKPKQVLDRLEIEQPTNITISSITLGELEYGVMKSQQQEKNSNALEKFLVTLEILSFDSDAAREFGKIRASLEAKGTVIGAFDMMIGAHAMARKLTIVTNNVREFSKIEGLKIENWVSGV